MRYRLLYIILLVPSSHFLSNASNDNVAHPAPESLGVSLSRAASGENGTAPHYSQSESSRTSYHSASENSAASYHSAQENPPHLPDDHTAHRPNNEPSQAALGNAIRSASQLKRRPPAQSSRLTVLGRSRSIFEPPSHSGHDEGPSGQPSDAACVICLEPRSHRLNEACGRLRCCNQAVHASA